LGRAGEANDRGKKERISRAHPFLGLRLTAYRGEEKKRGRGMAGHVDSNSEMVVLKKEGGGRKREWVRNRDF